MIGIKIHHPQTILAGPPLQVVNLFTTHVQLVGVFLMFGHKQLVGTEILYFKVHCGIVPTKASTSPATSVMLRLFGIRLRVIAAATMAATTMQVS